VSTAFVICGALGVTLRRHAKTAFSVVAVGATLAVPVVRFETLSLLLVALIPWTNTARYKSPVRIVE